MGTTFIIHGQEHNSKTISNAIFDVVSELINTGAKSKDGIEYVKTISTDEYRYSKYALSIDCIAMLLENVEMLFDRNDSCYDWLVNYTRKYLSNILTYMVLNKKKRVKTKWV